MKFFKKQDILIVSILVILAAGLYFVFVVMQREKPAIAEIYYKSELVKTITLNQKEDSTFTVPQNEHVVFGLYADGSIAFLESDCPDKVCIHSGKLNHVGQSSACLPNELIVKILPQDQHDEDDLDMIIR